MGVLPHLRADVSSESSVAGLSRTVVTCKMFLVALIMCFCSLASFVYRCHAEISCAMTCSVALPHSSTRFCLSRGPFKVRVEMHVISYETGERQQVYPANRLKMLLIPETCHSEASAYAVWNQTPSLEKHCWRLLASSQLLLYSASRTLKVDTRSQIEVRVTCQPVTLSKCGRRVPEPLLILLTHLQHLAIKLYFSYLQETISIA
jgi:hypothetical protein